MAPRCGARRPLGTVEEKKAKLSKPELRQAMRQDYDQGGFETLDLAFGALTRYIARKVRNPALKTTYEGLSVAQIAEREQKHVVDAMLDLSVATIYVPNGRANH